MNNVSVNKWCILLFIGILFFILNQTTYYFSDDFSLGFNERLSGRYDSVSKIIDEVVTVYFNWSGAFIPTFFGALFAGYFENKIWFNIANTIVFCVLLTKCSQIVDGKSNYAFLIFFQLFWFLCPIPCETLLWIAGSTNYLWNCTLTIVFITIFLKVDRDTVISLKVFFLAIIAFLAGSTHVLSSAVVCGALLVYYFFNRKTIPSKAILLSVFFALGTIVLYIAPGNYQRYGIMYSNCTTFIDLFKQFCSSSLMSFGYYKAVYALLIGLVILRLTRKNIFQRFCEENLFLLVCVGWGIIAFSFVFRSAIRSCLFPELISIILLSKLFLLLPYKRSVCVILCFCFVVDYASAVFYANKNYRYNETCLSEMQQNGGILCYTPSDSPHRMVNPIRFDSWSCYGISQRFQVPSVSFYPKEYCKKDLFPELCIKENNEFSICQYAYKINNSIVLQVPKTIAKDSLSCTIEYTKSFKWHRGIREFLGLYQYKTIERDVLPVCFSTLDKNYYVVIPSIDHSTNEITKIEIISK